MLELSKTNGLSIHDQCRVIGYSLNPLLQTLMQDLKALKDYLISRYLLFKWKTIAFVFLIKLQSL